MELELMTFADLLALHNRLALKPAGPKTFASRARMIERIRKLAADKNVDLASFGQPAEPEMTVQRAEPQVDAVEATEAAETKKHRGNGVGELARRLLMNDAGLPHAVIASMVNAEIPGAAATSKSVRWYACKMRKEGAQVPERKKSPAAEVAEQGIER